MTSKLFIRYAITFLALFICLSAGNAMAASGYSIDLCSECHGYPPLDGTSRNSPEGAVVGSHGTHVSSLGLACNSCHPQNVLLGHRTGMINMTSTINGYAGSFYDKNRNSSHESSDDDFPQTSDMTGDNLGNCVLVYCHSSGQGDTADDDVPYNYATPRWGYPSTGQCGTCHSNTDPGTGGHTVHVVSASASCGDCHDGAGDGSSYPSANHVNESIDVANSYTQGGMPGNGYGRCSSASCHDDGRGNLVQTPTWGVTVNDCSECHARTPSTGSHTAHLNSSGVTCDDCHDGAVEASTAPAQHLDGNVDVYDTTSGDLGYPPNKPKGSAYDNCTSAMCHGSSSPTWGTSLGGHTCTKCHGTQGGGSSESDWAPPRDTNGDTSADDVQVGAHQAHLTVPSNYTDPIACNECHTVPSQPADPGHYDTLLPAEVKFGSLAKNNGANPSYSSGTCANSYCHDGTYFKNGWSSGTDPSWNNTGYLSGGSDDCAKCHGNPPGGGHPGMGGGGGSNCSKCHSHVASDNQSFDNPSLHMNGTVEGSNMGGGGM